MSRPSPKTEILQGLKEIFGPNRVNDSLVRTLVYAQDISPISLLRARGGEKPVLPDFIVWPETVEEVSRLMRLAGQRKIPVTPYGGGSSMSGASKPIEGGIICDMKRMKRVLRLDEDSLIVSAQTGLLGVHLEHHLQRKGYTLGHFPLSHHSSTLGGMLAGRSAGVASTGYGRFEDMVVSLQAVLPDGSIVKTRTTPRSATGPNLNRLFAGSQGTLAIITRLKLRIKTLPPTLSFDSYTYRSFERGVRAARTLLQSGAHPAALRLSDPKETSQTLAGLEKGIKGHLLILIFEGHPGRVTRMMEGAGEICRDTGGKPRGEEPAAHWHQRRFAEGYRKSPVLCRPGTVMDSILVGAPWSRVMAVYEEMRNILSKRARVSATLSHAGMNGATITFAVTCETKVGSEVDLLQALWQDARHAAETAGGTFAPQRGAGVREVRDPAKEWGAAFAWYREIKEGLDPFQIMNPGKIGRGEGIGAGTR